MILQLNPYLPLMTPMGYCEAFAMSDPGDDHFPLFYCFTENRLVCTFESSEVRQIQNLTQGRKGKPLEQLFTPEQLERWKRLREL